MEGKWFWFIHEGGQFPVCFRPYGVFYSPDYTAASSYTCILDAAQGMVVQINFGKYGQYELRSVSPSGNHFEGSLVHQPEKWRRLEFIRDFNDGIL